MDKFLAWLEKYKIIAEIFQYLCLSVFGVIISIKSCSYDSESLSQRKKDVEPLLKIVSNLTDRDTLNQFTTQNLIIINEGEPLNHFKYQVFSYYKSRISCGRCVDEKYFHIPVSYYFEEDSTSNKRKDTIIINSNKDNFSEYVRFFEECKSSWGAFGGGINPTGYFLVHVKFNDKYDNPYEKWYKIENDFYSSYFPKESVSKSEEITETFFNEEIEKGKLFSKKEIPIWIIKWGYIKTMRENKSDTIYYYIKERNMD